MSSAARASGGSSPAQRVAKRDMSWFEPVHAGHAPSGRAASVASTTARMAGASNGRVDEREVEGEVQLVVPVAVERGQTLDRLDRRLADQDAAAGYRSDQRPPPPEHVVHLGPIAVVDRPLAEELGVEGVVVGRGRVVAELRVLDDDVAHVDAEAGHAPVEPEAEDAVELVAHLVVPPVEIGLLGEVVVEVVLTGGVVERPGRAAEAADPVVRRRAVGLGVGPDVPVAVGGRASTSGSRRTTGADRWCGWGRSRAGPGCPGSGPRR